MGKIIRAVAGGDFIKISVIEARDIVERARQIHSLSPTACAALGRTLCAASMMGDMMKEENGSLTCRINGGGPAGSIVCVAASDGCVKGYIQNPRADLPTRPDGKLDVGGIVGRNGLLTVSRDIGLKDPYVGSTELVTGEIGDDFTKYYAESEQVGAAVGLGVLVDTDFSVKAAGGFIVQLLPGAPEEVASQLEDNIFLMDSLTTILSEDGVDEVLSQVLKGLAPRVLSTSPVSYRCGCSREKVRSALLSLSRPDLEEMISEGKSVSAGCQFCDSIYTFETQDLKEILAGKKS